MRSADFQGPATTDEVGVRHVGARAAAAVQKWGMPRARRAPAAPRPPLLLPLPLLWVLLAIGVLVGPRSARAQAADPGAGRVPRIEVYTMGPGDELFSRFGHAAICVLDDQSPAGRCYNYGTADFSTPGPLTFRFLRGQAQFWVSVAPLPLMIAIYRHEDRTLYRQVLPLSEAAARRMAATLHQADVRERTFYLYHHFRDNCTTRLRDLIDAGTDGALRRGAESAVDPPLRAYVYRGFAGETPLLVLTDLVLGRAADRPTTRWQGMFLPDVLRSELQARLHAEPEVVYARQAPLPGALAPTSADPDVVKKARGAGWPIVLLGGLLALGAVLAPRPGRWLTALLLGGLGTILWALIAAAALPELRYNEVALLCWPTDLSLLWLSPLRRRLYLRIRMVALLLGALVALAGLLLQPLVPVLLLCGLPLVVLWRAAEREGRTADERTTA